VSEVEDGIEARTRAGVERLYEAYFAGDAAGMVDAMSEDVWVRFLGRVDFRGKEAARDFFGGNNPLLVDLQFDIKKLIVDGHHAAAIWEESATTIHGRPYRNHGVDIFTVEGDKIVAIHENNDIRIHRDHFGS
jgi:ketosteroid isomerase-like protein